MICINHANANYCDLASQSNTHIPAAPGVPAWDTWREPNMHFGRRTVLQTAIAAVVLAGGMPAQAQEVLNIYSARHYQTDDALYSGFTEKTGIEINRIEAASDALIERTKRQGGTSPADICRTVDAGRHWRSAEGGQFHAVESAPLNT